MIGLSFKNYLSIYIFIYNSIVKSRVVMGLFPLFHLWETSHKFDAILLLAESNQLIYFIIIFPFPLPFHCRCSSLNTQSKFDGISVGTWWCLAMCWLQQRRRRRSSSTGRRRAGGWVSECVRESLSVDGCALISLLIIMMKQLTTLKRAPVQHHWCILLLLLLSPVLSLLLPPAFVKLSWAKPTSLLCFHRRSPAHSRALFGHPGPFHCMVPSWWM